MMGWLRKGGEAARRSGPHLWPSAADAGTRGEAAASHWAQAQAVLTDPSPDSLSPEAVSSVFNHLDQISVLLLAEVNGAEEAGIGPVLDTLFVEDVLGETVAWALAERTHHQRPPCVLQLLKLFEGLVTQSFHCLLVHKPVLLPLVRLLRVSSELAPAWPDIEKHFVLLLNQISTKMASDSALLEFFFSGERGEEGTEAGERFVVFTLQIPYLYQEGDVGQLARDAVLLVLAVSAEAEGVGHFVAERTAFCPVLASGLCACFSQLPRQLPRLLRAGEDWHRLTGRDVEAVPALSAFYGALVFANAVVQVAHPFVVEKLCDYVHDAFLRSVLAPAISERDWENEVSGLGGCLVACVAVRGEGGGGWRRGFESEAGLEELVSTTAYVELCVRTVSEGPLVRALVKVLLEEDGRLLSLLVSRCASTPRLAAVSLRLVRSLLELNCEDMVLSLVLQHLLPATHVLPSQLPRLSNREFYASASARFLALRPAFAAAADPRASDSADGEADSETRRYLEYLDDAKAEVEACAAGCASAWALPYDGEEPEPWLFRADGQESLDHFARSSSFRASGRPNSYFVRRHTSAMTTASTATMPGGPLLSPEDLRILGPEEMEEPLGDESGSHSSLPSTPRFANGRGPAANTNDQQANMFRLTYEDEDWASTGGEESDGAALGGGFVLRGWAEVLDPDTFKDVLNRVRTSAEASSSTLTDNLRFLDKVHRRIFPELSTGSDESESKDEEAAPGGMSKSKDSGMGESSPPEETEEAQGELRREKASSSASRGGPWEAPRTRQRLRSTGIPVYLKGEPTEPSVGPLLSLLLERLEKMPENPLSVNLQLTGVLARLAVYPQPLLSSYLLNPSLVLQPSVPSLFLVLCRVRESLGETAAAVPNFAALVSRGRRALASRARRHKSVNANRQMVSDFSTWAPLSTAPSNGTKDRASSDSLTLEWEGAGAKDRSWSDSPGRSARPGGRKMQHLGRAGAEEAGGLEGIRTRTAVYAALVLDHFLMELAAIAQEMALTAAQPLASAPSQGPDPSPASATSPQSP